MLFMRIPDGGSGGEKSTSDCGSGDCLGLSQLGQASLPWHDSAQFGLARPGSGQFSSAQLGQACLGLGPAQIRSQFDSA